MKIRDIMTTEVELVHPDMTLRDAAQKMRDADTGFLPVGQDDRLVGTLTDRDITIRAVAEGHDPKVSAFAKPWAMNWSTVSKIRTAARPLN